jgi:hypothetical protein
MIIKKSKGIKIAQERKKEMNYKETYFWRPGPKFKIYFPIEMVPCIS